MMLRVETTAHPGINAILKYTYSYSVSLHQNKGTTFIAQVAQYGTIMFVIKRNGRQQSCQFDKIQSRISKLCYGLDQKVRASASYVGAPERMICEHYHDVQLLTSFSCSLILYSS